MRKKILFSLICLGLSFLLLQNISFAKPIEGGVTYNVDSAREYVKEGIPANFDFSGHASFENSDKVQKAVYTYSPEGAIIGVTVQYKGENDVAYIYGRDFNLKFVDKYDRNVKLFPHRGYRYDLNGTLILTSLTVSKKELFRFTPEGQLLVHSINGIIYDENGRIIGRAK